MLHPHASQAIVRTWGGRTVTGRSLRVVALLAAVATLSLADLLFTLNQLQTVGMAEANPIVVLLVKNTQSPWVLALFKALTAGACVALLYRGRHHITGELGAWLAAVVLVGVGLLWHFYSGTVMEPEAAGLAMAEENWLVFD